MRTLFILSLLVVIPLLPAHAGEPYECGVPLVTGEDPDARMPEETGGRCDIHDRRFTYREEALKMKELIKKRQENYAAPKRQIKAQYEERLEALNAQRGSSSDDGPYELVEEDSGDGYLVNLDDEMEDDSE